jgi:DNA polymerase-4
MTGSESASSRCILHVDMDAFFVSVELLRHPELVGRPVVVGGTGHRGVVAAASYEARRYGIRSATPSTQARRLCPEAVFLPGDHARYAEVSSEVFAIFSEFTPLVEGISLDEAFLDVTGARRRLGTGTGIAAEIRRRVQARVGLACSVGVAPNKFLAKLASKAAKPIAGADGVRPGPGVVEVVPGDVLAFLGPLAVEALWGVGPATLARLHRLGVSTVGDLAALGREVLVTALGPAAGAHLFDLARGVDHREVQPNRELKSVGHEETFTHDLHERDEIRREVVRLSDAVAARLRRNGLGARTFTLKIRFSSFSTITRSVTVAGSVDTGPAIAAALGPLIDAVDPSSGVRLVGVSGSNLAAPAEQLGLFGAQAGAPGPAWGPASAALDDIRERFGAQSIGPASTLREGRLRPVRRGEQAWGPDQGA